MSAPIALMATRIKLVLSTSGYVLVCWHCLSHGAPAAAARRSTAVTARALALRAAPPAVAAPSSPTPSFEATRDAARPSVAGDAARNDAPIETALALQRAIDRVLVVRTIQFAPGSDQVARESLALVAEVAALLQRAPRWRVEVAGHTDSIGDPDVNVDMSARRAAAVARLLAERGVAFRRIRVIGKGATRPVADNTNAEGRARNRRIQFTVIREG